MPTGDEGSGGSDNSDSDEDDSDGSSDSEDSDEDEEEEEEPLSLAWPDTRRKQATYLILLPIVFPLWLTVPDVRNQVETQKLSLKVSTLCSTFASFTLSNRNQENSSWSPSWAQFCGLLPSPTLWCGGPIRSVIVVMF